MDPLYQCDLGLQVNKALPLLSTLAVPQDSCGLVVCPNAGSDYPRPALDLRHRRRRRFVWAVMAQPLPGIAPVAMREGQYVADLINQDRGPDQRSPFTYTDRGMLATIGRAQAVAQIGPVHTSGLLLGTLVYRPHFLPHRS